MDERLVGMKRAKEAMEEAFSRLGLDYPVPSRHASPDADTVRTYMRNGPQVMAELYDAPVATRSFASAVTEHVSVKVKDQWDNAKHTFEAAPDSMTRSQLSYWLEGMCGSSKARVQDLVDFVSRQRPEDLRDLLAFLAPKVNQEQWDSIAPKMTAPRDQQMLRNLTNRRAKALEKNGVIPWFPEIESID